MHKHGDHEQLGIVGRGRLDFRIDDDPAAGSNDPVCLGGIGNGQTRIPTATDVHRIR